MKTGILFLARMGSQRLPGKHLLPVCGKPAAQHLLDRTAAQFRPEIEAREIQLILATAKEEMNRAFESLSGVSVFYGDVHNIPLRVSQAAAHHGLHQFLLVDGDDILCSPRGMRAVYRALCEGRAYVCTKGLPFGMNSQGFQTDFYQNAAAPALCAPVLETGWGRVFPKDACTDVTFPKGECHDSLRFTLDYPQDLTLLQAILSHFSARIPDVTDAEILAYVVENKLYQITLPIQQAYWERFHAQVRQEDSAPRAGK